MEDWIDLQRLWHRWHAPRDFVSPMRWYLTAAWPDRRRLGALAEPVDACLQELDLAPPAARIGLVADALGLSRRSGAVLAHGSPVWALPAMLHASLEGRVFIWFEHWTDLLRAVADNPDSAVICVPLRELDLGMLQDVVAARTFRVPVPRLREIDFQAAPISFLTARSLDVLSRVVAKHRLYRELPVQRSAWIHTGESGGHPTDPDVTFLVQAQASAAYLELLDRPDLLFLAGHSREDLIHLGADALCGASLDPHPSGAELRLPACDLDGRCVKAGRVIPVTSLGARGLFVHGCNLMRLGGEGSFEPEYTLVFSALEGSCNVAVASRRTRFGHAFEQILMYQLLRSGRSVGEAARLVNNTLPFSGQETPDYLVLGDGDWQLWPAPAAPGARIELERLDEGWAVTCHDVDTPVLQIDLPQLPGELTVAAVGPTPARRDLHYSVAPEPDGSCKLLVFGWSRVVESELRLRVTVRPPAADTVGALRRAHQNQAYGRLYRAYLPRFDNQETELRSLSVNLARHLTESRYLVRAATEAEARAAEVDDRLGRLDR